MIRAGNTPPDADHRHARRHHAWKVGDTDRFSGPATDPQQGSLRPVGSWALVMQHCAADLCHTHPIQDYAGVASGSFYAPDHEYPSYLELTLTATDAAA